MTDDPRPLSRELLDAIKAFGDHPAVGYLLDAIRKELRTVAALSPEPERVETPRCPSGEREDGSHYCADCDGYFHAPTEAR